MCMCKYIILCKNFRTKNNNMNFKKNVNTNIPSVFTISDEKVKLVNVIL